MDSFSKPGVILLSIFIFLIGILIFVFSYIAIFNKPSKPQELIKPQELPAQEEITHYKSTAGMFSKGNHHLEDFDFTEYTLTDSGEEKSFVISGKKLQTANPKIGIFRIAIGKIVELENPTVTLYKDNLPVSIISSKAGTMNTLNKGIEFYGNAGLITKDKRTLTCDKLKWNNEEKFLLAEGNCILSAEGKAIKAEMIKTDTGLKDFNVVSKNRKPLNTVTKMFLGG